MFSFHKLLTSRSRKIQGPINHAPKNSVQLRVEELESRLVPTALTGGLQNVGQVMLPLPGTAPWFQANFNDPGIRTLAQGDFTAHHAITRADVLGIFNEVAGQGAITSAEVHDLQFLVTNDTASVLHMASDVRFEANQVVNDFNSYQGTFIGNLQVGTSATVLNEFVDKCFLGMDHPIASANYTNVSGSLYVNGTPSYLNVHQGQLGDCWLMSSLAEVAAREPSVIQNMFTYEGLHTEFVTTPNARVPVAQNVGVWEVRFYFPNGNACYVTVDGMLPGGGKIYAQPTVANVLGNGAMWVALAEKAYVQANGDGFVTSNLPYQNQYEALDGGSAVWALSAIVGPNAPIAITPSNVAAAWNAGDLVIMATGASTPSYDLVPDHAYAVVGYNASSTKPFTVYNPWGTNAAGWAPYQYNGFYVYGKFSTTQAFLTTSFSNPDQTSDSGLRTAHEAALAEWLGLEAAGTDVDAILG